MFSILKLTSISIFQYNSAVHLQFQIFTNVLRILRKLIQREYTRELGLGAVYTSPKKFVNGESHQMFFVTV